MRELSDSPPSLTDPVCQAPTQAQLESAVARHWLRELREPAHHLHRKYWEYAWLLQALAGRGLIAPGRRGLGFAVGREPIAAYLASAGVQVLATDGPGESIDCHWRETGQHAASREDLNLRWLCPPDRFAENVRFRVEDMRAPAADLADFDFCWSLCAIEHLGDLDQLRRFVTRSLAMVKPGGWVAHSGELFCGDANQTPPLAGPTIIPGPEHYRALAAELESAGHAVAPLNFNLGADPLDRIIDTPPYSLTRHLKLDYQGVATTSFGLLVQRQC